MKWSIFVCLVVCLARFCDGLAIKCLPGATDPSCTKERKQYNIPEPNQPLSEASEVECLAGSEWESNCHYCHCSYQGRAECLKQTTACDKEGLAKPALCKSGTVFQRDCNTCICESGLGICNLQACTRSDMLGSAPETLVASDDSVLDNKDAQKSAKTDIVAPNQNHYVIEEFLNLDHDLIILKRSTICKPLQEFMRDCNPCKCASDGLSYSCTHNECLETEMDKDKEVEVFMQSENLRVIKKECRPNELFELDCNMCRCNPDGKSYACTRRACEDQLEDKKNVTLSRKVRALTTEPPKACQPGQEFRMDCNKCLCDNKGQDFSCTRIDCNHASAFTARRKRDTSEQVTMQCVPGSVFDRDCNVCRCTESGQSATCTIKRCKDKNQAETEKAPESDPNFRCNPGEQFRRDCNDCTCSADGRSIFCTLRLCDQALSSDI